MLLNYSEHEFENNMSSVRELTNFQTPSLNQGKFVFQSNFRLCFIADLVMEHNSFYWCNANHKQ